MPRQPLPINLHGGPWEIGPRAVENRPDHVAAIGRCLTLWPDVLHQLALLLGILLGVNSEAAIAVFSTIRNERGRREAIRAAANHSLDARQLELLEAVMLVIRSAEKERDALAHGCYGYSSAIDDGVLWVESKHIGPWNVGMLLKDQASTGRTGHEHKEIAKRIFVYRKADLIEAVNQEIYDAWKAAFDLHAFIRTADPEAADPRYRQLCDLPRVATALHRIREDRRNGPQSLP